MRVSSYLLLLLSFGCGIAGSFFVAYTFFWKKAEVVLPKQMVPILVAKYDIPLGTELNASQIQFEQVAIDELPEGALARFTDAVHSKALFPISRGYPICRDMIVAKRTARDAHATFVPLGFRIVSLEVRQSAQATKSLSPNQYIDITLERNGKNGRFALMRDETLGERYFTKNVLEKVLVKSVEEVTATDEAKWHLVSLLLTPEQNEMLLVASAEGNLRIAIAAEKSAIEKTTDEIIAAEKIIEKNIENISKEFVSENNVANDVEKVFPREMTQEENAGLHASSADSVFGTQEVGNQEIFSSATTFADSEPMKIAANIAVIPTPCAEPTRISHSATFVTPSPSSITRIQKEQTATPAALPAEIPAVIPISESVPYSPFGTFPQRR